MNGIRNMYNAMGVENFYKTYGNQYKNPHAETVSKILRQENFKGKKVLDLCCGSGEVTKNINADVIGCDPYTSNLYKKETGRPCYSYSFQDIAQGKLRDQKFDVIICSFALHLCPASYLNPVLFELALISNELIIITPNKKPEIKTYWKQKDEKIVERVRMRRYMSLVNNQAH